MPEFRPVSREHCIERALELLRRARNLLTMAKAPKAADKVRRAMKSAEGAIRHAHHDQYRAERNPAWSKRVLRKS